MKNQIRNLGAIGLVVLILVGIGALLYNRSEQSPVRPTNATSNSSTTASAELLVRPDSPMLGPADAKVTLVEFYDPECEACAAFHPIVKKILKDYEGRIRLVTRYMPLHQNSLSAASFTEAAGEQGKYWQAQELLFQKQGEWGEKHGAGAPSESPNINVLFQKYAEELGLDLAKANAAVRDNRFRAKIDRDKSDGQALGVRQTPTFFVNGRKLMQVSESALRRLIDEENAN